MGIENAAHRFEGAELGRHAVVLADVGLDQSRGDGLTGAGLGVELLAAHGAVGEQAEDGRHQAGGGRDRVAGRASSAVAASGNAGG